MSYLFPFRTRKNTTRLQYYDYHLPGLYFITINIQDKLCLFGRINNTNMIFNAAGRMIRIQLIELKNRFSNIKLHEYIIMPNHIHCIIEITDEFKNHITPNVGAALVAARTLTQPHARTFNQNNIQQDEQTNRTNTNAKNNRIENEFYNRATTRVAPTVVNKHPTISLGGIIGAFKSITTVEYIKLVKNKIVLPFDGKLWQKRYYDRIIRNEKELYAIRQYISTNPRRW